MNNLNKLLESHHALERWKTFIFDLVGDGQIDFFQHRKGDGVGHRW